MNWLRHLVERRQLERDLSDEIAAHLDERADELVAQGLSRHEAQLRAHREFGNVTAIEERSRDVWRWATLENLWTDTEDFLEVLHRRLEEGIKGDMEKPLKRRTSIATVDTVGDTNPLAMTGTALDVDKLAEEDIGVLALECLKSIFVIPNRSQIHGATASLLRFLLERVAGGESVVKLDVNRARDSGWAISIFNIISRWAPMQDRYVILVAALDTLLRVPIQDQTLQQQMALTAMMSSLLRSDVNLIGLSVMDVLLGLIKQMRKLYKLRSPGQSDDEANATTGADQAVRQKTQYLLNRLELCIGDLATVGQGCAPMFDGTAATLPACRFDPSNTRGRQQVWHCQDLIALLESDGFVGSICYYDATSHALVGASRGSDTGALCGQTSLTIEAGRTNVMCLENAPTTDRLCSAPDGGG